MDRGIRPYASSAKNYNEMMDEETEQYYRSRNYNINPSLKQPYTFNNYTEMMYLYSGGEQRPSSDKSTMDANMFPVVLATVTSPDYEFFDFFVEEEEGTTYYFKEDCNNLDAWTVTNSHASCSTLATPAGHFTTSTTPTIADFVFFTSIITSPLSGIPDNFTFEVKTNLTHGNNEYVIMQTTFNGSDYTIYLYPTTGSISLSGDIGSTSSLFTAGIENTFKFVVTKTGTNLATIEAFVNGSSVLTDTNCIMPDTKNSLKIAMGAMDTSTTGKTSTFVTDHIYIY